jgi:branched-chain amino acid transport system substrate-binding protein
MQHRLARRLLAALAACAAAPGRVAAAGPIRIGVVNEITGPQAEAGQFTLNGIKLALEEINRAGGVLGRPLELRIEDNASTDPGTVLAFSKLASEGGIAAIIGPIPSTQIQAASPSIA